jgi:hypothetical protein
MAFEPNTTPTPNWLYNGEMKKMNETELKVVLLVTRKTLGWFDPTSGNQRKEQDYISQSQFINFTGQSNRAIATAIQTSIEKGWIIAKDKNNNLCNTSEKRARRKIWYQLGNIFMDKISGEECSQASGEHNDINLVKNVHSTKETITKEKTSEQSSERKFSLKEEITKLENGTRKDYKIIAHYLKEKNLRFDNKEQYITYFKRCLKAAKELKGYNADQVQKTINHCRSNYDEWTLETISKTIVRVVNQ